MEMGTHEDLTGLPRLRAMDSSVASKSTRMDPRDKRTQCHLLRTLGSHDCLQMRITQQCAHHPRKLDLRGQSLR